MNYNGTSWYVEIREDSDDGIVFHSVECLAEIDSSSYDSFRGLGSVIKILEDKVKHSDNIVDNGAARQTTKLIQTNVRLKILPDPSNKQLFHSFT